MKGWQVGDLAVCVDADPHKDGNMPTELEVGRIYRVNGFARTPRGELLLIIRPPHPSFTYRHPGARRFRKVDPPKHEACESEFVTLLTRIKRKQGADA